MSVLGPAPPGHTRCLLSETPRCHSSNPRYPSPQLCQVPLGHSHFTNALRHNFRLYQHLPSFLSHHQLQCSVSTISSQVLLLPRGGGGESLFTVPQAKSIWLIHTVESFYITPKSKVLLPYFSIQYVKLLAFWLYISLFKLYQQPILSHLIINSNVCVGSGTSWTH